MAKILFLFFVLVLYFNPVVAGITLMSKGITGGKHGGILVGSENLMTLCVEGSVVLYISEPNTAGTAVQLLDSDSKPLGCPDPGPLGIRDKIA